MSSSTSSLAQTLHSVHLGMQVGESLAVSSLGQSLELLPFSFLPGSRTLKLDIFLNPVWFWLFMTAFRSENHDPPHCQIIGPPMSRFMSNKPVFIYFALFSIPFIFLYFIFFQNFFTYLKYVLSPAHPKLYKKSYWFTDRRSTQLYCRNCTELVSETFAPKALALSVDFSFYFRFLFWLLAFSFRP